MLSPNEKFRPPRFRDSEARKRGVFDVLASRPASRWKKIWSQIYNGRVLNLRPKLRKRHPWLVFGGAIIVIFIAVLGAKQLFTRAEVTDFFPALCLGEWENAHLAQGEPESFGHAEEIFPNATNSALYGPSIASSSKIFCGGFIPDNFASGESEIKNVGLTLVWQAGEKMETSDSGQATSISTDSNPSTGSGDKELLLPEFIEGQNRSTSTNTDSTSTSVIEGQSEGKQNNSTTTTSFISKLKNILSFISLDHASAQADSTSSPQEESVPIHIFSIATSTAGQSGNSLLSEPVEDSTLISSTSSENIVAFPVVEPSPPDKNFLKLSYSTDGDDWFELGRVNPQNWLALTVPLSLRAWDELQNLQIRIEGIETSLVEIPKVYLDGMFVEVIYEIPALILDSGADSTGSPQAENGTNTSAAPEAPEKPEIKIFDEGAKHKCSIEPFSQSVKSGKSATYKVSLYPSLENSYFELLTGDLPIDFLVSFSPERGVGTSTPKLTVNVAENARKASFDIVVVYREIDKSFNTTANFCQLNLIITD